MNDLYDLLGRIKKRPAMYLGRHSIVCLQAFLAGYNVARRELGLPPTEQDKEFEGFQAWVKEKFGIQSSQSWDKIVLFYSADERTALDLFFQLFEEFVSNQISDPQVVRQR